MEKLLMGSQIMLIGMGCVFFFLVVMIFVMQISAKIIAELNKYFPQEIEDNKKISKKKKSNDEEIALAIACAINQEEMKKC